MKFSGVARGRRGPARIRTVAADPARARPLRSERKSSREQPLQVVIALHAVERSCGMLSAEAPRSSHTSGTTSPTSRRFLRDARVRRHGMARLKLLAACLGLALAAPRFAGADPWKDEGGNGRGDRRGDYRSERWDDRRGDGRREREARRDGWLWAPAPIPQGHLPPPGEFRLWYPDRPPGHQPPPQRW